MESDLEDRLRNLNMADDSEKNPFFQGKDLENVAKVIASGRFKKIALMVGAGISVNAGIPDFRSKGGLYDTLRQQGFPKPEMVFDIELFKKNPEIFYKVAGMLDTSEAVPTLTHYFFKLLEDKGLLLKCYTQNIDGLEIEAGVSKGKLMQAHGHMGAARCIRCKKEVSLSEFQRHVKEKTVFYCEVCVEKHPIKPDVVFFGDPMPADFGQSVEELENTDLLIITGTSLAVHPFASLVHIVPKGTPRILINKYLENTYSFKFNDENVPDIAFEGDCDTIFRSLADLCGWGADLTKLIQNTSYIGALDFGTGSTRFMIFDNNSNKISMHQQEITQSFPNSGMHEQDPLEYLSGALECIEKACENIDISLIKTIGISNQRETIIAWDTSTGLPLYPAIIWDDTRTSEICAEFSSLQDLVKEKTGLPISTYFSATKIIWLMRNVPAVQQAISENRCKFGTLESWVIYKLTKEKKIITEVSNASRTMIMNLLGFWDEELLEKFGIPLSSLPEIRSSSEEYGHLASGVLNGVRITGALGDQQAALLGHHCLDVGSAKCTYGTGAFLLMNTGETAKMSKNGMLTTVFGRFGPEQTILYALEGAAECAGSAVQWMKNQLGLIQSYEELENLVATVNSSAGTYFVPALSGLFAPYWNNQAKGVLVGLTQHTTKAHIARAVLEGICFRTAEIIKALQQDLEKSVKTLSVDGGMTKNEFFIKQQVEIAGVSMEVPEEKDLTALGAALVAGIGAGVYKDLNALRKIGKKIEKKFSPQALPSESHWTGWEKAVKKCLI